MVAVALVDVQIGRHLYNVPGARLPVIRQIHKVLVVVQGQRHLVSIKGPRSELHDAGLLIEGEVGNIDGAGALVNGRRNPENLSRWIDQHVGLVAHLVVAIGTVGGKVWYYYMVSYGIIRGKLRLSPTVSIYIFCLY